MKTKHWIIIIAIALAGSLGLGAWLLLGQQEKHYVTVIQDGKITMTLDLSKDKTLTLTSAKSVCPWAGVIAACPSPACPMA